MIPFYDIYGALVAWIFTHGVVEINARTGVRVKVGRGGTAFRIDLSDGILPTIGLRKTFPKSAAAEVAWYIRGEQSIRFIQKYAPLWDQFTEDLPSGGTGVKAAYGYRWRRHFGRDQLRLAVETLKADSSDRRCYISAWDPSSDGLGEPGQRNVPCPAAFTFSLLEGDLHSSIFLRSSDLFVGLPYDVMGHALLIDAVANELGVRPGVMHVTLAHVHLYEPHWGMATEMMRQEPIIPALKLPGWPLSRIEQDPDDYVCQYSEKANLATWPTYSPRPVVVE